MILLRRCNMVLCCRAMHACHEVPKESDMFVDFVTKILSWPFEAGVVCVHVSPTHAPNGLDSLAGDRTLLITTIEGIDHAQIRNQLGYCMEKTIQPRVTPWLSIASVRDGMSRCRSAHLVPTLAMCNFEYRISDAEYSFNQRDYVFGQPKITHNSSNSVSWSTATQLWVGEIVRHP